MSLTDSYLYINQATRLPSLSTTTSSGGDTLGSAAAGATPGASLTRCRVNERCGSRHVLQSIRAHIAALSNVATASVIWTQAITIKSRDEGIVSSSTGPSL